MRHLFITFLVLYGFCFSGYSQDAREIVKKSHEAVRVSSFESTSTLVIMDGRGNERVRKSTMASMTFPDQTEKRIIKFTYPAEVKGTGILIYDHESKQDDMWVYLPAMRKTRRIVSSEKSKGFMGSEFSNADMTAPLLEDFTYTLLGTEVLNNEDCWVIESVPVSMDKEEEYGYIKAISWLGKNDYLVRRTKYYDLDGDHFKTIDTKDFKLMDPDGNKYMITEMYAENLSNGRTSSMKMDQIQISDTDEDYFTVTYLER